MVAFLHKSSINSVEDIRHAAEAANNLYVTVMTTDLLLSLYNKFNYSFLKFTKHVFNLITVEAFQLDC